MWHPAVRQFIDELPARLEARGLFPHPIEIVGPTTEPEVTLASGKKIIQFSTGNYLGLATHPAVKAVAKAGIDDYGMTISGSRLVCGTQKPHLVLEKELADLYQEEDVVIFFLVTIANMAAIPTFMGPAPLPTLLRELEMEAPKGKKVILYDWLSHPSVIWACVQAVGRDHESLIPFRHSDMVDLVEKLAALEDTEIRMIVTDGVFSADGDLALLNEIVRLARQYNAMVAVDDAHGTGVLGENGRGTWELLGVEREIDFKICSLAKAYASGFGAFIVGDQNLISTLRVAGNHYMFGGSMPQANVMAMTKIVQVARAEPWRRKAVLDNAQYLRNRLNNLGFDTFQSETQIVPILIGEEEAALSVCAEMIEAGFLVPVFRYPAVPKHKARIRATMMATHTCDHIDRLVDSLTRIEKRHRIKRLGEKVAV